MGLPNCFRVLAYSTVMSRVRCMPPTNSAARAAGAMSKARGRSVAAPISSAGVLLNSTTYSLRVRSMADIGHIFRPRALESTTKTPLRAATMMKPSCFWSAVELENLFYVRNIRAERFDQSEKLLLDEKDCCSRIIQNVAQFALCEPD